MVKKGGSLLRLPPWDLGGLSLDLYFLCGGYAPYYAIICMYMQKKKAGRLVLVVKAEIKF